jgi:hypothetical protein
MGKLSQGQRLKKAVVGYKKQSGQMVPGKRSIDKKRVQAKYLEQELMKPVAPLLYERPKSVQAFHEILAMQWGFMFSGSKITDSRREILSAYTGAWVGISGVITDAKLIHGILRICLSSPSLITNDQNNGVVIDSHLWLKLNQLQLSDVEDGRINNSGLVEDEAETNRDGTISLGDVIQFEGMVEPYVTRGKVKYGIKKFKNLSRGYLSFYISNRGKQEKEVATPSYPRLGWLIKATQLTPEGKCAFRYANHRMIQNQKKALNTLWTSVQKEQFKTTH